MFLQCADSNVLTNERILCCYAPPLYVRWRSRDEQGNRYGVLRGSCRIALGETYAVYNPFSSELMGVLGDTYAVYI
jgi:hypothetical protein